MRPWGWALIGLVVGAVGTLALLIKPSVDLYLWVASRPPEPDPPDMVRLGIYCTRPGCGRPAIEHIPGRRGGADHAFEITIPRQ